MLRAVFILGCLSSLPAVGLAQNFPPLATDDPGTPGDGAWEVNVAWSMEKRTGERTEERPSLEVAYGLGERFQVKYALAGLSVHRDGQPSQSGLGNSLAGVKWRFFDQARHGFDASFASQIEFRNPGSSAHRNGMADDETTVILPFAFQKNFGAVAVVAEVGRVFHSKSEDEWIGGIAIAREFGARLTLAVELNGGCDATFASRAAGAYASAYVGLDENSGLLVSLGREVSNADGERASLLAYVGWQLRL